MSRIVRPLARQTDLIVQAASDELLVYDTRTDRAHVLSSRAAAVWKACDGTRSVAEIAQYLSRETPTDEPTVWYALGQLAPLLQEPVAIPASLHGLTRRQFLRRAGAVAAVAAVPVVVSIVAPTPAHAQSVGGLCCVCSASSVLLGFCDPDFCAGTCALRGQTAVGCFDAGLCNP